MAWWSPITSDLAILGSLWQSETCQDFFSAQIVWRGTEGFWRRGVDVMEGWLGLQGGKKVGRSSSLTGQDPAAPSLSEN